MPSDRALRAVGAAVIGSALLSGPAQAGSPVAASSPPVVIQVTPAGGPVTGGTGVAIHGVGLAGTIGVSFGPWVARSFSIVSDGEIDAVAPPGHGVQAVIVVTKAAISQPGPSDVYAYGGEGTCRHIAGDGRGGGHLDNGDGSSVGDGTRWSTGAASGALMPDDRHLGSTDGSSDDRLERLPAGDLDMGSADTNCLRARRRRRALGPPDATGGKPTDLAGCGDETRTPGPDIRAGVVRRLSHGRPERGAT